MAILLAPVVIWIVIVMVVLTLCITVASIVISVSKHRGEKNVNHIPVRRIALCVALGSALLLVLSFLFGGTDEILVNGKTFDDVIWLKICNMFIISVIVMIFAAIGFILASTIRKHL